MNRFTLLFYLLLAATGLTAQQLSLFTQYRENTTLINPAAVESDFLAYGQNISFGASYRAQWVGLDNAPTTQTVRGTYLATGMSGVALQAGGHIINDQTGPTGFTGFYGRIAGIVTDDPEYGGFSVGLSAGFVQYRVRASELDLRDEGDLIGSVDQSQMNPDVGVGVFFYKAIGGRFVDNYIYGGISVPQVLGLDLTFKDDQNDFTTQRVRHYYGLLGFYKFFDNGSFLEPSVWVKYVENAPTNVDVNLRYQLPVALWIGAGGSTAGTVHLETGFVLGENVGFDNFVRLGYGYDYSFSSFGPSAGSTHELNVAFSFFN
jgi:type IX secretion system PorP/SprF family membrane protein